MRLPLCLVLFALASPAWASKDSLERFLDPSDCLGYVDLQERVFGFENPIFMRLDGSSLVKATRFYDDINWRKRRGEPLSEADYYFYRERGKTSIAFHVQAQDLSIESLKFHHEFDAVDHVLGSYSAISDIKFRIEEQSKNPVNTVPQVEDMWSLGNLLGELQALALRPKNMLLVKRWLDTSASGRDETFQTQELKEFDLLSLLEEDSNSHAELLAKILHPVVSPGVRFITAPMSIRKSVSSNLREIRFSSANGLFQLVYTFGANGGLDRFKAEISPENMRQSLEVNFDALDIEMALAREADLRQLSAAKDLAIEEAKQDKKSQEERWANGKYREELKDFGDFDAQVTTFTLDPELRSDEARVKFWMMDRPRPLVIEALGRVFYVTYMRDGKVYLRNEANTVSYFGKYRKVKMPVGGSDELDMLDVELNLRDGMAGVVQPGSPMIPAN